MVNIRVVKEGKTRVPVRRLIVFYDDFENIKKESKAAISHFLKEIAKPGMLFKKKPKLKVEYKELPQRYGYGEPVSISNLYKKLVIKHGISPLETKVAYFTVAYPTGIHEHYIHASGTFGNLAVISIYGIQNYIHGISFEKALLWMTLHEIGHTFGLSHHGYCAMDPLHAHLHYCKNCKKHIWDLLVW